MAQTFFYASGTFTPPAGVTSVTAEAFAPGGAGGTRTSNGVGGGGGGGGYSKTNTIAVTPGTPYTVNLASGQDAWFSNTGVAPTSTSEGVLAKVGTSVASNVATGAAGGQASSGIGDTKFSGGTGGSGSTGGGGGGGGAGDAGDGGNGADITAGTAGTLWGGAGGAGAPAASNTNGNGGFMRNGGGGGARRTSGTRNGGGGAAGLVIITYTPASNDVIYPDGSWENNATGTTNTVPVKTTSGNGAGVVFVQHPATRTITSVTWDGVGMTNEGSTANGGGSVITGFSLANPATGVKNVVATIDSSDTFRVQVLGYVGVSQVDPTVDVVTGSTSGTSLTLSGLTADKNGCWGVAGFYTAGGGGGAGTNFVLRNPQGDPSVGDTDGPENTGDFDMTSNGSSGSYIGIGIVLTPATVTGNTSNFFIFFH